jgi:uncharacterized protein YbbC (DUF1343 family)
MDSAIGDLNGDGKIDVRDVVLVVQHVLTIRLLDSDGRLIADLTGDGRIDVRDATMLMRLALGLDDQQEATFKLGNEVLAEKMLYLIQGKKVGLVTNQSGVNSSGKSTIEVLNELPGLELKALYGPEHGIDGTARAGEYVESYTHSELGIPVYSLYGATRMPTAEMLAGIDLLLFDVQDIGARSYTYISTLNYCMVAAEKNNLPVVVLDRPNPLGGQIVDGPVMEERFISFVGVDILPMAHGMTTGELARYFNRKIGAELTIVPMEGYNRSMIYQDTGLPWVKTSPNIPDLQSVFGYMVAGLGEGTGVFQADQFKWIGGRGLNETEYAAMLNSVGLPGIEFIPEKRGDAGGVRLKITDYHRFNPARTGIYALSYAFSLGDFKVPKSNGTIVMFDKIMGTAKMGEALEKGLTPTQIEAVFAPAILDFKETRKQYLLPQYGP